MWQYILLFLIVICQTFVSDYGGDKSHDRLFKYILYIYIVILVGLRYKVGVDTYNYMNQYELIPKLSEIDFRNLASYPYQPFYLFLSSFCRTIFGIDFFWMQTVHAALLNFAVFKFLQRNSEYFFTSLLIYLSTYFMYFNFEIMKESLAVAVFLLNYENLKNRRWFQFGIGIFIGFMFHMSALILVVLPFVRKIKLNVYFLGVCLAFFVLLLLIRPYMSMFTFTERMSDKVNVYVDLADSGTLNMNWVLLQVFQLTLIPLLLLYSFRKQIEVDFQYIILIYVVLGLGTIVYQMIFLRLTNYFVPFMSLFATQSLVEIYRYYNRYFIRAVLLVVLFCASYNYNYLSHGGIARWFPYHSIFNKQTDMDRDNLYKDFN